VCEIVSALSGVLQLANVRGTLMLGQHYVERYAHPFGPPRCSHMMLEDIGCTYKVTTPIHPTILLPRIVSFPFIWAILWCRPHGNHLKDDLAKFGDGNV
jgi:hypothetical protein